MPSPTVVGVLTCLFLSFTLPACHFNTQIVGFGGVGVQNIGRGGVDESAAAAKGGVEAATDAFTRIGSMNAPPPTTEPSAVVAPPLDLVGAPLEKELKRTVLAPATPLKVAPEISPPPPRSADAWLFDQQRKTYRSISPDPLPTQTGWSPPHDWGDALPQAGGTPNE